MMVLLDVMQVRYQRRCHHREYVAPDDGAIYECGAVDGMRIGRGD
jgi:hypothetical protein